MFISIVLLSSRFYEGTAVHMVEHDFSANRHEAALEFFNAAVVDFYFSFRSATQYVELAHFFR